MKEPEFVWGDIIQVPAMAFCRDGLNPEVYGKIYGVVVSSARLWYGRYDYECREARKKKKQEEQAANAEGPNQEGRVHPEKQLGGQYLVALIDNKEVNSGLEIRFTKKGPFKGWYIAAGLFVSVLDSQMESIPELDRKRGRLRGIDQWRLETYLKDLTGADRKKRRRLPFYRLICKWLADFWRWLIDSQAESP